MLNVIYSGQFKKDYKRCQKRGFDIHLLQSIVAVLAIPAPLPPKNKDHDLKGNYNGRRECHITPDWLLIYEMDGDDLYLDRTGTHADLFRMYSYQLKSPGIPGFFSYIHSLTGLISRCLHRGDSLP